MSRIGQKPIAKEQDVKVEASGSAVHVEGSAGKMDLTLPEGFSLTTGEKELLLKIENERIADGKIHGLFRSLLQNAVTGVKKPWTKTLELVGVGYRAQTTGSDLVLNLGFSHPINIKAPAGITFQVTENKVTVSGVDKYMVGEMAAKIRRLKPPEPYKGKGIRYTGEHIRKKLGKAAKAVGGAAGAK
ncbi:50S ribosomal protein L6 [Patescibacteria group bacterium]|nr:50S ribosomal protein L6 [Patescibacteria group bacterium]MCL5797256.1 50S ribosomal protein L6 [Patescibacteria group bacterium]